MVSDPVTIADCNARRIPVLFDSNVLLDAMRYPRSDQRAALVGLDAQLRFIPTVVLYEVAFARTGGRARVTNEENHQQLRDWGFKFIDLKAFAGHFDRMLSLETPRLRSKGVGLADVLVCAAARIRTSQHTERFAVATRNLPDFEDLAPRLVRDFLPP